MVADPEAGVEARLASRAGTAEIAPPPPALRGSTLLGIFFGVVMVCALFCAVGYLLGRRNNVWAYDVPRPPTPANVPRPASSPAPGLHAPVSGERVPQLLAATNPKPSAVQSPVTSLMPAQPIAAAPDLAPPAGPSLGSQRTTAAPQLVMVQVAALSRPEDAETLASTLRRRGFAAFVKTSDEDALYRVQIGPLDRALAVETKQRLQTIGYRAILK